MSGETVAAVLTVSVCSMWELVQSVFEQLDELPSEQMQELEGVAVTLKPVASSEAAVWIPVLS